MENLKKEQKANLDEFLDKMRLLRGLLESAKKLDIEGKKNIQWYCKNQEYEYRKRYFDAKGMIKCEVNRSGIGYR